MNVHPLPLYPKGTHVIYLADRENVEAIVADIGFTGRGVKLPVYRLDTIDGPICRVEERRLCPATNVTVLRHGARDTLPSELEPVA